MQTAAHTSLYPRNTRMLQTTCGVSLPFSSQLEKSEDRPDMYQMVAIWDTGSECTTISRKVAADLNLAIIGEIESHHTGGHSTAFTYLLNLRLPNGIEFEGLRVMDGKFDDVDVLIGMDVLSQCDFAITHPNNQTKVTFQIPTIENIDFKK